MNARQWLEKLVAFDTTSRNSNLELIHYCRDYLEGLGVACTLVHNAEKTKANLWATLPGEGGVTDGGIILSGHTDVVPVDGQRWDSDPFTLTEKDGKLYGRGTCDMKGFIAVAMSLVPEFLTLKRKRPIHLAWSYDEEVGCLGGRVLTEYLRDNNIRADGCIVGEPTSNQVIVAHKGIRAYRVQVRGKAVHSSFALTSHGCNAIDYVAKLVVKIRDIAEDIKFHGLQDTFFDVPFTTVSTNQIQGGNAMNTVPASCQFVYEMRNLPPVDADKIQEKIEAYAKNELLLSMKKEFPDACIEFETICNAPALKEANEKDPFTLLLRNLTKDSATRKVAYGTEGGQYQGIGIPVIVCGPGSVMQAHKANEFVPLEDLDGCVRILRGAAGSDVTSARPHL